MTRPHHALRALISAVGTLSLIAASSWASADETATAEARRAVTKQEMIEARQHYFGLGNVNPKTGDVRKDVVILSWTGVSGFAASFKGQIVLMDAYVARDGGVLINGSPLGIWPSINYIGSTPRELASLRPELVILGHTHFDHAGDLPAVIRANPGITVAGTAEHCTDIQAEVRDVNFNCVSLFPANAPFGMSTELRNKLEGVEFTAIKQPHSSASPNPAIDPPFGWNLPNCSADTDYPVLPGEPVAWGAPNVGPPSGAISVAWQIRVGKFAIAWQDTAGYIDQNVVNAFAALPRSDVRFASVVVAGRSTLALNNRAIRPKVFYPLHHDACGYLIKKDLETYLATLPDFDKPKMVFMSDPSDYLKPIVFDPSAEAWKK
jgi:hypothetical protein